MGACQLIKAPLPKMPPPRIWGTGGDGGGGRGCTVLMLPCMKEGLKFMTWQALMSPS